LYLLKRLIVLLDTLVTINLSTDNIHEQLKRIHMIKLFFISVVIGLTLFACGSKNSSLDTKDSSYLDPLSVSDTAGNVSSDNTSTDGVLIPIAEMHNPRAAHTATLLKDGTVLICGGFVGSSSNGLSSAEIYNPSSKSFTQIDHLTTPRFDHSATLLPNGKSPPCWRLQWQLSLHYRDI
jgi:hypothetical protein